MREEYITQCTLEKSGHLAAKYHSNKVVDCNHLIAISCVPGYSARVECLKKQLPELFIPPNSIDGTHLKGHDLGTATHTVALLQGKEITMKSFLVDSMNEYMDTFFFKQETSNS
eukprot:5549299-Ditylum_brightwellii.AAC.1